MLAIALDLSNFGQDWVSWQNIELGRILFVVAIVTAIGLFLALFLFRSEKYKQRLLWTVPIAFSLVSIVGIALLTIHHYGLNEQYNYFTAKRDIKNGKVQILQIGLIMPMPNVDFKEEQEARKIAPDHFNYKPVYLGCVETDGIAIYNSVMEDYLEKLNGKGWRVRERQMVDSILQTSTRR